MAQAEGQSDAQQQEESNARIQMEAQRQMKRLRELKGEKARRYQIDPITGFALDLDALNNARKRKKALEVASLLPASARGVFLWKHGVINKEDIPEKSAKELLDLKRAEIQLATAQLSLENAQTAKDSYISQKTKRFMLT